MDEESTRVLVTGSTGLVGRWLCDLLYMHGFEVLGLDLRSKPTNTLEWNAVRCNILSLPELQSIFRKHKPQYVVHLAARTDLEGLSIKDYEINTSGVENICIAARDSGVQRILFASSQLVCEVGHRPDNMDEYNPNTIYGESKVQGERAVKTFDFGDMEWVITRPTTVWGPFMSAHYVSVFKYIENGRYFHPGKGDFLKSYSFAGNIAYMYYRLLSAPHQCVHQQTFYLADYDPLSLREYLNTIADRLSVKRPRTFPLMTVVPLAKFGDLISKAGIKFPFNSFRLRNIRTEYLFETESLSRLCGELPFSFQDGVDITIKWYKEPEGFFTHNAWSDRAAIIQ